MYPLDKGLLLFTKLTNKCMHSSNFSGKILPKKKMKKKTHILNCHILNK